MLLFFSFFDFSFFDFKVFLFSFLFFFCFSQCFLIFPFFVLI